MTNAPAPQKDDTAIILPADTVIKDAKKDEAEKLAPGSNDKK